jgi:hypothetical protein
MGLATGLAIIGLAAYALHQKGKAKAAEAAVKPPEPPPAYEPPAAPEAPPPPPSVPQTTSTAVALGTAAGIKQRKRAASGGTFGANPVYGRPGGSSGGPGGYAAKTLIGSR